MTKLLMTILVLAATGDGNPTPRTDIIGTWEVRTTPTLNLCRKGDSAIYNWVLDVADYAVQVEVTSQTHFKMMSGQFEKEGEPSKDGRLLLVSKVGDARAYYAITFNKKGTKFTGRRGVTQGACYSEWKATGRKL